MLCDGERSHFSACCACAGACSAGAASAAGAAAAGSTGFAEAPQPMVEALTQVEHLEAAEGADSTSNTYSCKICDMVLNPCIFEKMHLSALFFCVFQRDLSFHPKNEFISCCEQFSNNFMTIYVCQTCLPLYCLKQLFYSTKRFVLQTKRRFFSTIFL